MTITDPCIVFSARTLSSRLTDSNQDSHLVIEMDPAGPAVQFGGISPCSCRVLLSEPENSEEISPLWRLGKVNNKRCEHWAIHCLDPLTLMLGNRREKLGPTLSRCLVIMIFSNDLQETSIGTNIRKCVKDRLLRVFVSSCNMQKRGRIWDEICSCSFC